MTKVVLANTERLDLVSSLAQVNVLDSPSDLSATDETVSVLSDVSDHLSVLNDDKNEVYIPSTLLTENHIAQENVHVYFDLENFPFYQRAKDIIEQEDKPKGVFRYRRMVTKDEKSSTLIGDLYVLSSLLGDAEDIKIKQTDQSTIPAHTIITVNFGGGTMAHIEYTVSDRERIELEWSGVKNIIEFDSDEMSPIEPIDRTKLPLLYTVDSILETAHQVDQELLEQLNNFTELVNGGGN